MQGFKQKKSLVKQNISQYLSYKDVTHYEFYKESGITRGILEQNNGISEDNIARFLAYAPDVNIEWLLTGEGNMLKANQREQSYQPISLPDDSYFNESTPTVSYNPNKGAPYYNVDFLGGFDFTLNDQTIIPEYNIDFKPFNKPGVIWVNITGHSMEPKISHGDIIAIRKCRLEDVQYGEIYAIVLDTLRTVKILRRSTDPTKMRYVPINKEDFDEQEYDNSRILHIFEVLGNISRFI